MSKQQTFPDGLIALALHQASFSDKQLRALLLAVGSLEQALALSPADLASDSLLAVGLSIDQQAELSQIGQQLSQAYELSSLLAQQWQYCLEHNIGILTLHHPAYPALLKQTYDPPPILYYRGNIALLNSPQLAMVGSRRSSQQGNKNAAAFAKTFASAGFTITSGMALGIDTASHQGALAAAGNTIAVLGTGIDVIYPKRNQALYQAITEQGLIISELPLGSEALKGHFPRRNRIISGMSLGVLVVEASLQSGSLITAQCAIEQGREVFAIPGSIHNHASRGCHALIRQGAKLVETVEHVMEELGAWLPSSAQPQQQALSLDISPQQQQLLDQLGFEPLAVDLLQQRINLPMTELMASLVQLELDGLVENVAGCYQRVV
ncbi:DNA-processing protein DprA [Dasania sp. GY-MA-18]|uniref:DNA-processing protein DprA n=1 Tax=Dasania phycosphaerae TaxID=2950436 RepID=A0A9J6RQ52_9GAMM|nr:MULTISPECIES: DNA-processing protein DprA [Dasania]MCR8923862.1 DNA-processing protein DprA [Dasania sp. GY-MA-18]MCZ0866296.1 DNA-processing protein DprA [Dasania phycosphaerae]MCZ0870020.1 DNA-processing protein DprA [Dasania phycosphaerae]